MAYLSQKPPSRKQSVDPSGGFVDSKFETKAYLMESMKNLIDIDSNLLHSDYMRNTLPGEMIKVLEEDTSQSG